MWSGYNNDDTCISNLKASNAMCNRDTINIPTPSSFGKNLANLLYCHFLVYIIFQVANLLTPCIVTYHTLKDNNASCARICNRGNKCIAIKRLSSNLNKWLQNRCT